MSFISLETTIDNINLMAVSILDNETKGVHIINVVALLEALGNKYGFIVIN
jgi:hypothetical protein